jgi:hypothetical protein
MLEYPGNIRGRLSHNSVWIRIPEFPKISKNSKKHAKS